MRFSKKVKKEIRSNTKINKNGKGNQLKISILIM
jgi:hypothetical protein